MDKGNASRDGLKGDLQSNPKCERSRVSNVFLYRITQRELMT